MWTRAQNTAVLVALALVAGAPGVRAEGQAMVMHDFEKDLEEWSLPDWEMTDQYYAAKDAAQSTDVASSGTGSAKVMVDFPGGRWVGAYLEKLVYVTDWGQFGSISVDVYVPADCPPGMKAKIILTVGEKWTWTEMNRSIALAPGKWTTITANLKAGSQDWKFFPDDAFRKDVRKLGVRIESDKEPVYIGPVYIDNVRLLE